ncbi:MAG: 4Fe-4S dicluster domain-containing protein [Candidatus Coatesbacteria bacterium]|nr:MAG: 4Fe-4S dicluster domain-containing protein [Candidatus Coatesbacteria bacterium]
MATIREELQAAVRRLFEDDKIDYFLGYVDDYGHTFPAILTKDSDLSGLTFDRKSYNNLAAFLPELRGSRLGLICKQCEVRTLNVLAAEEQLEREKLVVVGVPCPAMIDPRKLSADEAELGSDDPALWQEKCRRCLERNTPTADLFVGEKISTPTPAEGWPLLEEVEAKPAEEREAWWREQMSLCIRCYACRLACPLCYCHQCFVEDNKPQWLDKSVGAENNLHYHIIRAIHLAGRCIECQECSRVCPVGIPVDVLNNVLSRDFASRFGYASGETAETKPALVAYERDDPEDFIL